MKNLIFSFLLILTVSGFAQSDKQIEKLDSIRKDLIFERNQINDSIKQIDAIINSIKKSIKTIESIPVSSLKTSVLEGAVIMDKPEPLGEKIAYLIEGDEVMIKNYNNPNVFYYFEVCTDLICGFMSPIYIRDTEAVINYKKSKIKLHELEAQKKKQKQENQQRIAANKKRAEKEQYYINKFGKSTYESIKKGRIWLGMTSEMARMSKGRPQDINRTVTAGGISEQWVYGNYSYLYFDDGILTAWQD